MHPERERISQCKEHESNRLSSSTLQQQHEEGQRNGEQRPTELSHGGWCNVPGGKVAVEIARFSTKFLIFIGRIFDVVFSVVLVRVDFPFDTIVDAVFDVASNGLHVECLDGLERLEDDDGWIEHDATTSGEITTIRSSTVLSVQPWHVWNESKVREVGTGDVERGLAPVEAEHLVELRNDGVPTKQHLLCVSRQPAGDVNACGSAGKLEIILQTVGSSTVEHGWLRMEQLEALDEIRLEGRELQHTGCNVDVRGVGNDMNGELIVVGRGEGGENAALALQRDEKEILVAIGVDGFDG